LGEIATILRVLSATGTASSAQPKLPKDEFRRAPRIHQINLTMPCWSIVSSSHPYLTFIMFDNLYSIRLTTRDDHGTDINTAG